MMGEGRIFKERQREQVICPECSKDVEKGSLLTHHQKQNSVEKGGLGQEGNEEGGGEKPRTFRMEFPAKVGLSNCPVKGCSVRAATRTAMRVHFWHRHVWGTVVIIEEGNLPHQW